MSNAEWQQKGLDLHYRLLRADPTAPPEIFETFLPNLVASLEKKYPTSDRHLIWDVVTDCLFKYIENPQIFDPTRKSLWGFLKMAAFGDLLNAMSSQKRHSLKIRPLDDVALSNLAGNINIEDEFIFKQEIREKMQNQQQLKLQVAGDNSLDQQLMVLLQQGERRTSEFARILQLEHLPKEEQERIVKKHKDRLKLRLKRQQAKG